MPGEERQAVMVKFVEFYMVALGGDNEGLGEFVSVFKKVAVDIRRGVFLLKEVFLHYINLMKITIYIKNFKKNFKMVI